MVHVERERFNRTGMVGMGRKAEFLGALAAVSRERGSRQKMEDLACPHVKVTKIWPEQLDVIS